MDENFVEDIYGKVKEQENYEIKKCFKLIFKTILQKYFSTELAKNNNIDALDLIKSKIAKYLEYIYGKISKDKIKQDNNNGDEDEESIEKHIESFIYNAVYSAIRNTKPDYSIILDLISSLSESSSRRKLFIELIERYSKTDGRTLGGILNDSNSERNNLEKKLIHTYKKLGLDKVSLEVERID